MVCIASCRSGVHNFCINVVLCLRVVESYLIKYQVSGHLVKHALMMKAHGIVSAWQDVNHKTLPATLPLQSSTYAFNVHFFSVSFDEIKLA